MTKLTPRQIEVLTEIFEGREPNWREMNAAQRNGRRRVVDGMRGYSFQHSIIHAKTGEITSRGLKALEPHYPDKSRMAAAIEKRRSHEEALEAEVERLKREREEAERGRISSRNAKLIEGYRRILADHHIDVTGAPDDLVLTLGNAIADFEMRVGS